MTLKQQRDRDMEEFEKRFPNLNDSTEKGGYDAKVYVKGFINQIYINIASGEIDRIDKKISNLKKKAYNGNNLESANDHYCLHAENWQEIIRHEQGIETTLFAERKHWQDQLNGLTNF